MLAISLMRLGAKGKPFYRLVVKEKRSKRDGKYLENVGTYNPMTNPAEVELKHERIQYWISVGAQPTETVASLIKNNPEQTEEQKAAAAQAKVEKAEADKKRRIEEAAAKREAARLEAEKAEAEKREAEKAEAAQAEAEIAETAEVAEPTETAETVEAAEETASAETAEVQDAPAETEENKTEETA